VSAARVIAAAALVAAAAPALAAKRPLGPAEVLDLNRASAADLQRLPGVGEKRAQAILAARAKQPFRRVEDVLAVKGIGPAWLAKQRPHLAVSAAPGAAAATPAAPPAPAAAPAKAVHRT
jgi:competence protein ComEA